MCWLRTRKGRGYGIYDYKSHGTPHAPNSELLWPTKREFPDKDGVECDGFGQPVPVNADDRRRQSAINMRRALDVLFQDEAALTWLADRLVELGDSVPAEPAGFKFRRGRNPWKDPVLTD